MKIMWYVYLDLSDEDYLMGQILLRPMKMAKEVCPVYWTRLLPVLKACLLSTQAATFSV